LPPKNIERLHKGWVEYEDAECQVSFNAFPHTSYFVKAFYEIMKAYFNSVVFIGPYRQPPSRYYAYRGAAPINVGSFGEGLPHLLYNNRKLIDKINKWLDRLELNYQLDITEFDSADKSLFKIQLKDVRQKKPVTVTIADVGFGVSQLLPIIVQCIISEKKNIIIEQPELHIHPRLQADLGGLLAESYLQNGNRFIIETHSEHMVLRMQKLVREKKLKPEDVAIIYVKRGENGSTVERLRLDEDGDFIDEWPGGFFPERLSEFE